ncbi:MULTISPECIES: DnaB-like helicase C-terminal domain-containing protein [unclassified Streptomyces]|uniref:replicative DNA helicase n=1 Tax=unclassified Streptomyces TaxID=2593676 RepID=UPI0022539490|nr:MULTISPECIES: DnaB-like helicase C-terminal domain-containing protein [unclassified Streptomyces]MCX4528678.1 AAA family ATPase [Streptomyces sp. NBC_01551]MCX4540715.1 AAA family ATPase [Streptomyces sp. NBC_01565]
MTAVRGKRGIPMPDESTVAPGPHRDLLVALHEVYAAAGRPGLRTIARGVTADDRLPSTLTHHAIGRVLGGSAIPSPRQAHALAAWLAEEAAAGAGTEAEVEQTVERLVNLCRAVGPAAHAPSSAHMTAGRATPSSRRDGGTDTATGVDSGAVEAERRLLGAMLASGDAVADVVDYLDADDFTLPVHQGLYEAVLGLYEGGVETTLAALSPRLASLVDDLGPAAAQAWMSELSALRPHPTREYVEDALEVVYRRAQLRRLTRAGQRIADLGAAALSGGADDAVACMRTAEAEFQAVFHDLDSDTAPQSEHPLELTLDRIEGVGADTSVYTGFGDLDSLLNGLRPGHVLVLAGASGLGKSTLALGLIRSGAIAQGVATLYVTPDTDQQEVLLRLLSAQSGVPLQHMRSRTMTDDGWTRLARCMPEVSAAPLTVHDRAHVTVAGIRRLCRRLQRGSGLGLVVIDPVHWIRPDTPPGRGSRGEVVRELAVMAKELRVPLVLVAPLQPEPGREDRSPVLGDVANELVENADTVILLHREDAYERHSPRAGEADLVVAKHRFGPTATVTVAFQGHCARFVDIAPSG